MAAQKAAQPAEAAAGPEKGAPPPAGPIARVCDLEDSHRQLPSYALRGKLHRLCIDRELEHYEDPITREEIRSVVYLKRRPCCGETCRHCPYNYVNVPGRGKSDAQDSRSSSSDDEGSGPAAGRGGGAAASAAAQSRGPSPRGTSVSGASPRALASGLASPATEDALSALGLTPEFTGGPPLRGPPLSAEEALGAEELAATPAYALRGKVHRVARERQCDSYVLPNDTVAYFTQVYLQRMGQCCGVRCTHCPYSYRNCPKDEGAGETPDSSDESE
eukprot:TRINITY_DN47351_c0_g1_i1.p1 TRINITY_DN47351_c0_g1~~TRINITY_DN47351_c0_g1_i1.p1  ORF type:complete len:307 (+),score=71.02 TRINITY_DN47351_c0_g1_i1:97-921(+)